MYAGKGSTARNRNSGRSGNTSHHNINDFRWPSFRPPLETYKLDYGIGVIGYAGIVRAQQLIAYRLAGQFLSPERFGKPGFMQFANLSIEGPKFGFGPDGVVMAWQIHGLDSVRWLSGGEPVSVYGTNRNNAALYQIEFSSGAVCHYCEYHNEDNFRNETPLRVWAECPRRRRGRSIRAA